jgi:hypothetical protein
VSNGANIVVGSDSTGVNANLTKKALASADFSSKGEQIAGALISTRPGHFIKSDPIAQPSENTNLTAVVCHVVRD